MRLAVKLAAIAVALALTFHLVIGPVLGRVMAAYQASVGWTKQSAQLSLENQPYVLDAFVMKDGDTYRMWYTRVRTNDSLLNILTTMANLGLPDAVDAALEFRQEDLLNLLGNLDQAELVDLINSASTVIGYATSSDGTTWTVESDEVLAGDGTMLGGVGNPAVVFDGTTYRMWYTRLESDLAPGALATWLDDLDGDTAARQAAIEEVLKSIRTVIGYATSNDGLTWTVEAPQVLPAADGSLFDSVGAPAVINDNGTYRMWYTQARSDLTVTNWANQLVTNPTAFDEAALLELLDGTSTVIGYATSADGTTWTVQSNQVLSGGPALWQAVGDPAVVFDGTTYEMWLTRASTDLNEAGFTALLNEVNGIGLGGLWTTLQSGDMPGFLGAFVNAVNAMANLSLVDNSAAVIAYATSSNGADWQLEQDSDLVGATGEPWASVAAPSVVRSGSNYRIWFTEGVGSLTAGSLLDLWSGTDLPIASATFSPPFFFIPLPPPPPPPGTTDLTGRIDEQGVTLEEIIALSADGLTELIIPQGTRCLTAEGEPATQITMVEMETPPPPPEDGTIIGLVYDLGPEGITFDPPVTIRLAYDPTLLPEDVDEEDLVIAWWDADSETWVELDSVVDTDSHTISAQLDHFTPFAILAIEEAPPPLPPPTPPPLPSPARFQLGPLSVSPSRASIGDTILVEVVVRNTGGRSGSYRVELEVDGQIVSVKTVTLAAGASRTVPFTIPATAEGIYTVKIGSLYGSFTVAEEALPEAPAAEADFTMSNLLVAPAVVEVGQTVIVSVLVTNRGSAEGTYEVQLKVDGEVVKTRPVTLAANSTRAITFSISVDTPGVHTISVAGLSETFEAVEGLIQPPVGIPTWVVAVVAGGSGLLVAVVAWYLLRRRETAPLPPEDEEF